jgi:Predicted transcriptional regulators
MIDYNIISNKLKEYFKEIELPQKDIAVKLGVTQQAVGALLNGKPFGKKTAEVWARVFGFKPNWLLTGEGPMLKNNIMPNAKFAQIESFDLVPLVPIRSMAGYLSGYGDVEYIEKLPTIPVITDKAFKGKGMCFEIGGDSLDDGTRDALCNGDIVYCMEIARDLWRHKLPIKNQKFTIVHKDGITTKYITAHDMENGTILCHSTNPLFEDFEINLNDVFELYIVTRIVDRIVKN